MENNLTRYEKQFARAAGITAADVHKTGRNSSGTVYALYNPYYFTECTFYGYTLREVYRFLLRRLIKNVNKYTHYN